MRDKLVRLVRSSRQPIRITRSEYPPGGAIRPHSSPFVAWGYRQVSPFFGRDRWGTAGILDPTIPVWHSPGSPTSPVLACWGGGALGCVPPVFRSRRPDHGDSRGKPPTRGHPTKQRA